MYPVTRRTALTSTAALASATLLASCGGDDEAETQEKIDSPDDNVITDTDDPQVVKEKTEVTFMSGRPPTTAEDWNEVSAVKGAEEITNLHVNWGLVPQEGVGEKRNLALASGDYPEVFYRTSAGTGDIAQYGEQGTFVPLNDLIDEYMPNLTKIMDDSPGIRDGITFPDGNIYSLPQIYDKDFLGMRYMFKLWVRQDWLDDFGMDVPETLEEYIAYLEESVNTIDGAVGLYDAANFGDALNCFWGAFGVRNKGVAVGQFDLDPDTDEFRYFPLTDGYRDGLEFFHSLFEKGLIQEDNFDTDQAKLNTLGSDGLLASCATQTPTGFFGEEEGQNYIALPPLKKEPGDNPTWNAVRSEVVGLGGFVMTDKCEHPIEIIRWMDFWYSDEGSRMYFMGTEGESFEEVDGRYELMPEITDGQSIDDGLKMHALYMGGSYPARATDEWFRGVENTPQAVEGAKVVEPYAIEDVWEPFTFSAEESQMLGTTGEDIGKFHGESQSGFITGQKSLDEWDDYVSTFDQMGMEEYLGAHKAAYERRQSS